MAFELHNLKLNWPENEEAVLKLIIPGNDKSSETMEKFALYVFEIILYRYYFLSKCISVQHDVK